jgi:hypothetical protein
MPLHDSSYQHWDGVHLGVWHRRWAISSNGVRACLQNKWMRHLVVLCWVAALVMVSFLFVVGQLLVADSVVVRWVGNLNPQLQTFARTFTSWLEQHPEVSVRTTQDVLFFYFGIYLMVFSIFALGMAIPTLITRDLASNAIIVYSSKAISRGDYFLGKFATAFGLLTLTWLGPVCTAWLVGNLLAPDWRFFWHARLPLFHALLFGLSSMCLLSVLALGISATSVKEKSTVALWYTWWIIGGTIVKIVATAQPRLQHLSFNFNLDQLALGVFRLGDDLKLLQDNVPIFGQMLRNVPAERMAALTSPSVWGASLALLLMAGMAAVLLHKRVRPE